MRRNSWFPIIFMLSIAIIAIASFFNTTKYFINIANAITLPVFLLTVIELFGHVKVEVLREIAFETRQATRDAEWLKNYYDVAKDREDEISKETVKNYKKLNERISKLGGQIEYVDGWFKAYTFLSIFCWVFLLCAALLGNLDYIVYLSSKVNKTVITLFTLAIFIGEPAITDFFKGRLRGKAIEEVDL